MIELFDAERLLPKRDHSLALAALVLAAGAGVLAVHAGSLQQKLREQEARKVTLEGQLRQAKARVVPSGTLVADLQRELDLAEAELAERGGAEAQRLTPSAWLDRLAALGSPEVSLARIEVDAAGAARIEGMATHAQAVSAFVQAFSRHEALAGLAPRAVELRQDKASAPHLRFQMRAAPPAAAAATPATTPADANSMPAAAAAAAASSAAGGRS